MYPEVRLKISIVGALLPKVLPIRSVCGNASLVKNCMPPRLVMVDINNIAAVVIVIYISNIIITKVCMTKNIEISYHVRMHTTANCWSI